MLRKIFEAILLCALAMCVLFGVMETYFRLLDPQSIKLSRPDPVLGWIHIPNTVARWSKSCFSATSYFNREGMKDVNHILEKPSGVYRIAVLGDSYVEALQVDFEDVFFHQLEERLNKQGLNVQVLAFGMAGFGTDQEFLLLKKYALKYDPDLVILTFVPNDISNNLLELDQIPAKPYFDLSENGHLFQKPFRPMPDHSNSWKSFLFINSHTIRFLYYRLGEVPVIRNALVKFGVYADKTPTPKHSLDLLGNSVYLKKWPDLWERGWAVTKGIILEMKRETEKHGADFLLFSVTRELEVSDDEFQTFQKQYPQLDLDEDHLDNRLKQFSQDNGVVFASSLAAMRELHENGIAVHLTCDGHWTKEAHHEAGEILSKVIQRSGFLQGLRQQE